MYVNLSPLPAASTVLGVATWTPSPASQLTTSTLQESLNYGCSLISRQECSSIGYISDLVEGVIKG